MFELGSWSETAVKITAGVFVFMYTVKMVGWLLEIKRVQDRIRTLYTNPAVKAIYLLIHLLASVLLLTEVSPAGYIVAVLAVGGLYDYFFALFPEQSRTLVLTSMADKGRMWYFGIVFPLSMLILYAAAYIF